MDPQAALERYWNAVDDGDHNESNEAFNSLRHWLDRGGFEPDWAASGHTRAAFFAAPHRTRRTREMSKPIPYDDDNEAPETDERDMRWIQIYDDEALEAMQGWTGGQSDPLYAISSSGGANYAWVFVDAISNVSRDISRVQKIGRNKFQLGKGTFTKKEIDELYTILAALESALDEGGEVREAPRGAREARGGAQADPHAAHELVLYIENTSDLSPDGPRGQGRDVLLNALRKWKKGTYDPDLAVKLFGYLVESGAKRYAKEHGSSPWNVMFSPATRQEAARQLEEAFRSSAENGEYDRVDLRSKRFHERPTNDDT